MMLTIIIGTTEKYFGNVTLLCAMKLAYYMNFPFHRILFERHQLSSLFQSEYHTIDIGKVDFLVISTFVLINGFKKTHAS